MQWDSDANGTGAPCLDRCPAQIRATLQLVAGKWMAPLVIALYESDEPLRYAELQRRLAPITPRELAKQLRAFESAGIVRRDVYATVPPSVEYALTVLGRSLYPTLEVLAAWSASAEIGADAS
jgi:DNA-binding HxlR family transcriptional regulator